MAEPPGWDPTLPSRGSAAFRKASTPQREEALRHATQFLDLLPFKGRKATEIQALAWPRVGAIGKDGKPTHGVPAEIKEATGLIAGFILAKVPFDPQSLAHVFLLIGHLIDDPESVVRGNVTWH